MPWIHALPLAGEFAITYIQTGVLPGATTRASPTKPVAFINPGQVRGTMPHFASDRMRRPLTTQPVARQHVPIARISEPVTL